MPGHEASLRSLRKHSTAEVYSLRQQDGFTDPIQNRGTWRTYSVQDGPEAREVATKLAKRFFSGKAKELTGMSYSRNAYGAVALTKIGTETIRKLGGLMKQAHRQISTLAVPSKDSVIFGVYANSDPTPQTSGMLNTANKRIGANNDNSLVVELPISPPVNKPDGEFGLARIRLNLTTFVRDLVDEGNIKVLQKLRNFLTKAGFTLEQMPQSSVIAQHTHESRAS